MTHRRKIVVLCGISAFGLLVSFGVWNLSRIHSELYLRTARIALSQREVDQAMSALNAAIRLNDDHGETYFLLARTHRRRGEFDAMRRNLAQANLLGYSRKRIQREQLLAAAQFGQITEALPKLKDLLLDPGEDGPDICEAYANGLFLSYRFGEAFQLLDAWEKDFPNDPQPVAFRGEFAMTTFAWAQAEKHFERALSLAPRRWDIRLKLSKVQITLQKYSEAEQHVRSVMKIRANDPEVQYALGLILVEQGNFDGARAALDAVLKSQPEHFDALLARGQLEMNAGRYAEAVKQLELAVSVRNYDSQGRYALANALQRAGRPNEALPHFEFSTKAREAQARLQELLMQVTNDALNLETRYEITDILKNYGSPAERSAWLRSIIEIDPNQRRAHLELAEHYEVTGRPEAAEHHRQIAATIPQIVATP